MPLKEHKPTSPGRRNNVVDDFSDITKKRPEKSLLAPMVKKGGRNNKGRITVRRRGGGHKASISHDRFQAQPIRGSRSFGNRVRSQPQRANRLDPIRRRREVVHRSPARTHSRSQGRSGVRRSRPAWQRQAVDEHPAGNHGSQHRDDPRKWRTASKRRWNRGLRFMAHEGSFILLRLPSGEMRQVRQECRATIGVVSNSDHKNIKLGKAGRSRHRGKRPSVRGTAMAPDAHAARRG